MIKLIIFDWDDVITKGSTQGYFKCYHETIKSFGIHLDPEEEKRRILSKWGTPVKIELQALLKERPDLIDQAEEEYEKILLGDAFINCLSLVSDKIPHLFNKLKNRYSLAIATGINPQLLKEKIMPKFGVPSVFIQIESVYYVPSPDKGKPHPYMIEQILSKQNISPKEVVMVGDAKGDVLMAQNAGVEPVVVLTGHLTRKEAENLGVKHIIDNVLLIETVLNKII